MIDRLLQIIAPHHCYGCQKSGQTLCDNCKYNITNEPFSGCIVCRRPTSRDGVCSSCKTSYDRAWAVASRTKVVEDLLNGYKFERQKSTHAILASLLDEVVPIFSDGDVMVVPIPTISAHIRERGYDHVKLFAQDFAKLRDVPLSAILRRKTKSKQLGSSRSERYKQAAQAFGVNKKLNPRTVYVLVDDIFTTGATMQYAAQALRDAGAKHVWIAVIARQPLDK